MLKKFSLSFSLYFLWTILLTSTPATTNKFTFSFSERFRFVSWDNTIDLEDSIGSVFSFTRHRTSLGFKYRPGKKFEFNIRVTNEFRNYLAPCEKEFNINEIFFDQLNAKFRNIFSLPLTLTLGRQNIMLGEGFICFDSQPLTGSRSAYFNALRADLDILNDQRITMFLSYMPRQDNLLPIINNLQQDLSEQSHLGFGIYYSGNILKSRVEAYYLRKNSHSNSDYPDQAGINTFGSRISIPIASKLSLTLEGAVQSGYYQDQKQASWGGYFHFDYLAKHLLPWLKQITVGAIYLSGDNTDTANNEAWKPVFSRWPKWSESYIYTLIKETKVANWSNFNSLYFTFSFSPGRGINFNLSSHFLGAQHAPSPTGFPGGTGKTRGLLIIGRLIFDINKYLSGHLVWENFKPGDFYFSGADSYNWIRFELVFKI